MKRFNRFGLGLALALGLVFASSAQAQMKVAIVNVGEVFQKYEKAKFYKNELDKVIGPKKVEAETLKKQMLDWKKALETTGPTAIKKEERPRYEDAIVSHQRKLQDIDRDVRAQVQKIQETQIVTLYRDLQAAIDGVAKAHALHLVLAYGDVTDDQFNIFNIQRKMNGMDLGSTTPLFFTPDVNITGHVVETLNHHYKTTGAATGTPTSLPK